MQNSALVLCNKIDKVWKALCVSLASMKNLDAFGESKCKISFPSGSNIILSSILKIVYSWFMCRCPRPGTKYTQSYFSVSFWTITFAILKGRPSRPNIIHSRSFPIPCLVFYSSSICFTLWKLLGLTITGSPITCFWRLINGIWPTLKDFYVPILGGWKPTKFLIYLLNFCFA